MKKFLAAIDFGTSCIKAALIPVVDDIPDVDRITTIQIDSLFANPKPSQNGFPHHLRALVSPEEYAGLVGTDVKDLNPLDCGILRTSNIVQRREFGMGMFYTLGLLCEEANTAKDVVIEELAIGFPASHQAAEGPAREILLGKHSIHISDMKERSVKIESVISRSQGFYVTLDQISHWTRNASGVPQLIFDRGKNLFDSGGQLLTMVHGSNTLEIVLISSSLHEAAQDHFPFGTYNHLDKLRSLAHSKIGTNLTDYELMFMVFPTGKFTYEEQEFEFDDEINAMVREEYEVLTDKKIHNFLETKMARPVRCISAGGGAIRSLEFLQEFYAKKFPVQLAVDNDGNPEVIYAVRRGMINLLIVKQAERLKEAQNAKKNA